MLRRYPPIHPLTHPSTHRPCIPPSIHPSSMHPFLHPPIHPSTHLVHSSMLLFLHSPSSVCPTIFHLSVHPLIPPSIHPSIYPPIHPPRYLSIHSAFHPPTHSCIQQSTYPPPSHHHLSIHACSHLHIICWPGHPPPHPTTPSPSPSPRPLYIHMLHFKMVNRTWSLSSQNLHVSDDHHDPRSTGLLPGQCLPNLAAPPSGPGHLHSKENKEPWMAFTLSLHLHDHISFPASLIYLPRWVKSQAGRCDT